MKDQILWFAKGYINAPEGQETHENNGARFNLKFAGPEDFVLAVRMVGALAADQTGCADDWRIEIEEIKREGYVYAFDPE